MPYCAVARRRLPLVLKGWLGSAGIHGAAAGLVLWGSGLAQPARIGARQGAISIQAMATRAGGEFDVDLRRDDLPPPMPDAGTTSDAAPTMAAEKALAAAPPAEINVDDSPPDIAAKLPQVSDPLKSAKLDQENAATLELTIAATKPADESPSATAKPQAAIELHRLDEDAEGDAPVSSLPSPASNGNETDSLPKFNGNIPIVYPREAVEAKYEGTVLLRLHIAANGRVTAVEVVRSSGYPSLDRAAVEGVKAWQAEPARVLGIAVETTVTLPVNFRLK